MDKYEYNLKQDQMKSLCAEENYDAAAEIADTINWNKIKNVNALVSAGEIYEKTGRYEDSKELLLMAYDRSPIGRTIIYRLAEVAVKMKDYELAQEYYEEFVEIAPHDNLKYVLEYTIKKAQGASYEELIPILEELKEQEYSEEWAYELAYLYHKAGMSEKCVEACDELILWFGDGPYVERALELKMLYQPLTRQQEEKYREIRQKRTGVTQIGAEEMKKAGEYEHEAVEIPQVNINPERFNTVNLQEEIAKGMQQILDATEKETVSDTMDNIKKMVEEIPYLQLPREEEEENDEPQFETDEEIDDSLKINFQEMIGEDSDGQMSMVVPEKMQLERQITGQMSIAEVLEEWEKTKKAAEEALEIAKQRKLESAKAKALQEAGDIMDRLTDVIPKLDAGISPRELLQQQYLKDEPEQDDEAETKSGETVSSEIPITEIDTTEPAEQQDSDELRELESDQDYAEDDDYEYDDILTPQEKEAGQIFADMNDILGKEIERLNNENAFFDEQLASVKSHVDEAEIPVEEAAGAGTLEIETSEDEMPEPEMEESEAPEIETVEFDQTKEQPKTDAIQDTIAEFEETDGIKETEMNPEEIADSIEQEMAEQEADQIVQSMTESILPEKEEEIPDITKRIPDLSKFHPDAFLKAETTRLPDIPFIEPEEKKPMMHLPDELRSVFSYFVPVKGMEDQLCQAIAGLKRHFEEDETAFTGNLIIQGGHGCGKTVLATSIIKAMQQETGRPNGRIGKIDSEALNHKNIQQLLRKVAGGCLIIENAGNLSRQSAVTLSLLLEQDSSGILVIMEDTTKGIKKALSLDDGYAKKFTEKINVPIFTNDELVAFAKSYSRELGYEMEEMAVLALYNRISNIQRLDQATTLTEVKEIVDEAIERSKHIGWKKAFSFITAKRHTEDDRILLRERDFEE
ncbi:hypothetical protein FYJ75_09095 [Roseburia sp. MUC/MUC-530-WT-4D]|uniref:Uncharacterized protein n=1 Tax=Roseburia porci TaxID=2605790 RepID=A0A6L5YTA4_9FIRM|nr:tetratricopeptide repeat protein [Roseburia porci]MDD6741936.1 tetratricopeptide repeat protein [Roseburia porci]MST75182.1 hypothetical protein [Roseburia porci]